MKKIKVNLGNRSYSIKVSSGCVSELFAESKTLAGKSPVVLIIDKNVVQKADRIVAKALRRILNEIVRIVVPGQEKSKSLTMFQKTVQTVAKKTKKHRPVIVAMGGGVVGDLAGFIAATYRRGVPLIQVPTTLLAQVDSSVGGKVGVDLPEAKNLVGAFYQPKAVIMDIDFLKTLPKRQIRNGLGEVIKYAIIKDKDLFAYLENNMQSILALKKNVLEKVVHDCASIKARVVEQDEYDDKDLRIILNFGHTLGHAIEAASKYSNLYNHGESISIGMVMATEIAVKLGKCKVSDLEKIKNLITLAGLPVKLRKLSEKGIMDAFGYDKKFTTGKNRFVIPRRIGKVEVAEGVPLTLIKSVIRG